MPFRGILDPKTVVLLTKVLDEHCEQCGIRDAEARLSVARSLIYHHTHGIKDLRGLAAAVAEEDDPTLQSKVKRKT